MAAEDLKVEALCREILDTVLVEIRDDFSRLPVQLKAVANETRCRYDEAAEVMRDDYRRQSEQNQRQRLSQAQFQAKRRVLAARDAILDELLDAGLARAEKEWSANKLAPQRLTHLVLEGVAALDSNTLVIQLDETIIAKLPTSFAAELATTVAEQLDRKIDVRVEGIAEFGSGLVIKDNAGTRCFDNRLKDRYRRARARLRAELLALLEEDVRSHREVT